MDYKSEFIAFMARAGALTFGDFVTKSGRNTPYFVNTGKYSQGEQIAQLGSFYAECIMDNVKIVPGEKIVLFGPAYKGITLAVATAIALAGRGINVSYSFNRKEVKDHGEGGSLVGHKLVKGDRVLIIEDVITAGTAVREVLPILRGAEVEIAGLVISVDRMERGTGTRTAIQEVWEEHKIPTFPIVTVRDILACLHNSPLDGKVLIDDEVAVRMKAYMSEYCV
ncbi:MAG: orotate phosphoribosyltransferase [Oscillospiraceae bacterium]|nr:orotate phosphoribosyltransferase [Oscillospiraceae bacterium]